MPKFKTASKISLKGFAIEDIVDCNGLSIENVIKLQ